MKTLFLALGITEAIIILLTILFPVWALIDILRSKFDGNEKLIWVLAVIFTNLVGATLYFLIGKKHKITE